MEKKHMAIQGDRDLLSSKTRDQAFQMTQQQEVIQDKDDKIEQL